MPDLAQRIMAAGVADHVFSERQLAELLGGSDGRRYGLVNRALKDGSLIRLKRGTYMLDQARRGGLIHPFAVAQSLLPGSYISFETALAYHGWIPEAVLTIASTSPGRKTLDYAIGDFGMFSYHPIAIEDFRFLTSVDRIVLNGHAALIAQPLRSLMDLVALRKLRWTGPDWLTGGMRIDVDRLSLLRQKDFKALRSVYKHKAVNAFLSELEDGVRTLTARDKVAP